MIYFLEEVTDIRELVLRNSERNMQVPVALRSLVAARAASAELSP